jgi:Secretion system C-terminal sorting domain
MRCLIGCAGVMLVALLVLTVVPVQSHAQIPNPGFEVWNAGFPEGWIASNYPGLAVPVTASTTRRSGSFAARGEVLPGDDTYVWAPSLTSIFSQTSIPQSVQFYYQFAPQGGDQLAITLFIHSDSSPIAAADTQLSSAAGAFTLMDLPVISFLPGAPMTCQIIISISGVGTGGEPTVGSSFIIDDIAFFGVTSIESTGGHPAVFALDQNYPNPFNPSTVIEYSLPEAGQVRLDVFNTIGERVATLVDDRQDAGRYRANFSGEAFPSGVYLYRLSAGGNASVKRMVLMK